MARPREFPVPDGADAAPKGGRSALKVVLVGAAVAFGGYSAVAGASFLLGPGSEPTAVAAKAELDCGSSRYAWRPECQAKSAVGDGDASRRTRRSSAADGAAPAEPVLAVASPPAAAVPAPAVAAPMPDPVATASVESKAEAAPLAGPERVAKRPEPVSAETAPIPPVRAVPREPGRPTLAVSPARERRAESPRSKPEPEAEIADGGTPVRTAKAKPDTVDERPRARAKLAPGRRDPAQFASLQRDRVERARRTRLAASAWRPEEDVGPDAAEDFRRSRRDDRFSRRRDRTAVRMGLPPGMTVTSVRTYVLPDGRLVSVNVRPRAEEVRALVAQHRANTGSYYPW